MRHLASMSSVTDVHVLCWICRKFRRYSKSDMEYPWSGYVIYVIPPFHWATIRSRSKPIWKSGPIGNKRELNGSDHKLSGNERQRSGMVGKVGGDLWTCSKIAPDLRGSGTGRGSSVRSVIWFSLIVSWSYESGTQRVLSGCRIPSRSCPL